MEIKDKITLDALSDRAVTIKTQRYIDENGTQVNVGDLHAVGYVNSEYGRRILQADVSDPYLSAILAIWGDTPKVGVSE